MPHIVRLERHASCQVSVARSRVLLVVLASTLGAASVARAQEPFTLNPHRARSFAAMSLRFDCTTGRVDLTVTAAHTGRFFTPHAVLILVDETASVERDGPWPGPSVPITLRDWNGATPHWEVNVHGVTERTPATVTGTITRASLDLSHVIGRCPNKVRVELFEESATRSPQSRTVGRWDLETSPIPRVRELPLDGVETLGLEPGEGFAAGGELVARIDRPGVDLYGDSVRLAFDCERAQVIASIHSRDFGNRSGREHVKSFTLRSEDPRFARSVEIRTRNGVATLSSGTAIDAAIGSTDDPFRKRVVISGLPLDFDACRRARFELESSGHAWEITVENAAVEHVRPRSAAGELELLRSTAASIDLGAFTLGQGETRSLHQGLIASPSSDETVGVRIDCASRVAIVDYFNHGSLAHVRTPTVTFGLSSDSTPTHPSDRVYGPRWTGNRDLRATESPQLLENDPVPVASFGDATTVVFRRENGVWYAEARHAEGRPRVFPTTSDEAQIRAVVPLDAPCPMRVLVGASGRANPGATRWIEPRWSVSLDDTGASQSAVHDGSASSSDLRFEPCPGEHRSWCYRGRAGDVGSAPAEADLVGAHIQLERDGRLNVSLRLAELRDASRVRAMVLLSRGNPGRGCPAPEMNALTRTLRTPHACFREVFFLAGRADGTLAAYAPSWSRRGAELSWHRVPSSHPQLVPETREVRFTLDGSPHTRTEIEVWAATYLARALDIDLGERIVLPDLERVDSLRSASVDGADQTWLLLARSADSPGFSIAVAPTAGERITTESVSFGGYETFDRANYAYLYLGSLALFAGLGLFAEALEEARVYSARPDGRFGEATLTLTMIGGVISPLFLALLADGTNGHTQPGWTVLASALGVVSGTFLIGHGYSSHQDGFIVLGTALSGLLGMAAGIASLETQMSSWRPRRATGAPLSVSLSPTSAVVRWLGEF